MRMVESGVSKRSMMHCVLPTASMQPGFLFNTRSQLLQEFASFSFLALQERSVTETDVLTKLLLQEGLPNQYWPMVDARQVCLQHSLKPANRTIHICKSQTNKEDQLDHSTQTSKRRQHTKQTCQIEEKGSTNSCHIINPNTFAKRQLFIRERCNCSVINAAQCILAAFCILPLPAGGCNDGYGELPERWKS